MRDASAMQALGSNATAWVRGALVHAGAGRWASQNQRTPPHQEGPLEHTQEQDHLVCEAGAAFTPCNPDAVSARTAKTLDNQQTE
ncbi:hypothetical protein WOLCODRAFT_151970 [Wolfiporia cocos MD-104 SS10]|uniref:Uncharacterized protein n=1 Tax=Wolfiporia cocos (strain MD-104) TaxID=742152 RepID=A0A2H3JK63_WOLCO|nr:hypothetical protein WOLCODRAFT_151970 [Wolfiporia cocos MD-104 SS10]